MLIRLESKKHKIIGYDSSGNTTWGLSLAIANAQSGLSRAKVGSIYCICFSRTFLDYVLALIQLGASALGYFEEGEVVVHKAIKKYMKRHKRGKGTDQLSE